MTYVLAHVDGYPSEMAALYNQWNYETIQPQKVMRFLKQAKKWNKNKPHFSPDGLCEAYKYVASIHDYGMSVFRSNNEDYELPRCGMYSEDNNNGWQIVVITKGKNDQIKINVGFKPGYEWGEGYEQSGYMPLKEYLEAKLDRDYAASQVNNFTVEHKNFAAFVASFSEEDQQLLQEVNDSFDLKIIKKAEKEIAKRIKQLQKENSAKAGKR